MSDSKTRRMIEFFIDMTFDGNDVTVTGRNNLAVLTDSNKESLEVPRFQISSSAVTLKTYGKRLVCRLKWAGSFF